MDWLVRPLAMTFWGGAVGGSSGRETLDQRTTKAGRPLPSVSEGQYRSIMGHEEANPALLSSWMILHTCCVLLGKSLKVSELVSVKEVR
jgi:hypothetical protein